MRVNAATIGAVTLGSSVMGQSAPGPVGTTDLKDLQALGEWTLDACHKIDSKFGDLIWPCASLLKTSVKLCPTFANTDEERIAQRDCLCGEGSSFLQDAVACSECKVQNGLQPDVQRDYWIKYYKEVDEKYCQAKEVPVSFDDFRTQLSEKMPIPEGGRNFNQHQRVIDPKSYYGDNVPKKQGAGKVPAVANSDKDAAVPPKTDPLAGQVKVPVFVAISDMPTAAENKTEQPIKPTTSAPFKNGTATIRPTGSLPSTFLTVTTSSSAGSPTTTLLPSSSVVPAPGTAPGPVEEHIIVIAGKPCVVYIVWVIVDCTPKTDAAGNFAIGYQTVGVDKKEPAVMLENNEQFDKIKGAIPDAGKDQKLAEDVKQHVGTVSPVVPAPAAGKNKNLPPVKGSTGETKVPSESQPANDNGECEVVDDVPQTQKGPNGGSDAVVPVGQGSQPSTGKPGQSLPNTPGQSSPSGPSNSGSGPSNSGSNTCDCECPSTIATAFSSNQEPEICNKKVETERACKNLSGRQIWECLCSKGEFFEKTHFFKEAVQCERRKPNLRESEFEAQIFFEVNARYCQKELFGNDIGAAYANVTNEWKESRTPSALIFCLLSLSQQALTGRRLEAALDQTARHLKKWKKTDYKDPATSPESDDKDSPSASPPQDPDESFDCDESSAKSSYTLRPRACKDAAILPKRREDDEHGGTEGSRSRSTARASNRSKDSVGKGKNDGRKGSASAPTRQYCTQACLLGLKSGHELDRNCPNVRSHNDKGGTKHLINITSLVHLMAGQLRQDPYGCCHALDGLGKRGSTGVLFRLEMAPLGYTFVGKGTVKEHLGIVSFARGYILTGGDRVVHMMLMSWGGLLAKEAVPSYLNLKEGTRANARLSLPAHTIGTYTTASHEWFNKRIGYNNLQRGIAI